MPAELFKSPAIPALDSNANPLPFATWNFYEEGTLTPASVYANGSLGTSLGSSVEADGAGRFPAIFLDPSIRYRGILKDQNGATIGDFDPVSTDLRGDLSASTGSLLVGWIRAATGAVARTASSLFTERTPTPLDFIPFSEHAAIYAGTSTYDASDAIEKAAALFRGVHFPGKRYNITRPLDLERGFLTGEGGSTNNVANSPTLIRYSGATPVDYMFKYTMELGRVENLNFDANYTANSCVVGFNCNSTRFEGCRFMNWKQSGLRFSETGNNSNSVVRNCTSQSFGSIYSTGTATVASGSLGTVTFAGTTDLTTFVRPYYSFVKLTGASGNDGKAHMVLTVTANTVTVYPSFEGAHTAVAYSLLDGNCIEIRKNGDNSAIKIHNCVLQRGTVGLLCFSLYASHDADCILETLEWAWCLGAPTYAAPFDFFSEKSYTEDLSSGSLFNASNASKPIMTRASATTIYDSWTPAFVYAQAPQVSWRGVQFRETISAQTNQTTLNADFGTRYDITQSTNDLTINLPTMTTGEGKTVLASGSDATINILLQNLGGRTVTVKSADRTVNGVAGATGVAFTTNYRRLTATYGPSNNWVIS